MALSNSLQQRVLPSGMLCDPSHRGRYSLVLADVRSLAGHGKGHRTLIWTESPETTSLFVGEQCKCNQCKSKEKE
ncbi:Pre-B-Cell Leukemia Transcription Factor-Interacting Protein 1 [Manis pentadactyla]|nr:Pre-B-Cell Leukemia Transcription Factor-Interacting Protein 1 [Manis pentadactyla]